MSIFIEDTIWSLVVLLKYQFIFKEVVKGVMLQKVMLSAYVGSDEKFGKEPRNLQFKMTSA